MFLPAFLILFLAGILQFWLFDRILRIEYQAFRLAWEEDGRPAGFFWMPPESSWFWGSFARSACMSAWLYKTPAWMRKDEKVLRLLFWYRLLWVIAMLSFVGIFSPLLIALIKDVLS